MIKKMKKEKKPRNPKANVIEGIALTVMGILLVIITILSKFDIVFLITGIVVTAFGIIWGIYWHRKSKTIKETRI